MKDLQVNKNMVQRYILFFNSKQNRIFFLKKYQKKLKAYNIISSMVGIAIIALPSGIITAGYLDELRASKEKKDNQE